MKCIRIVMQCYGIVDLSRVTAFDFKMYACVPVQKHNNPTGYLRPLCRDYCKSKVFNTLLFAA